MFKNVQVGVGTCRGPSVAVWPSVFAFPGTLTQSPLWYHRKCSFADSTETECEGWGVREGVLHSHFSHSLPMAARSKTVKRKIRIKVLTKRGENILELGMGTEAGTTVSPEGSSLSFPHKLPKLTSS